jgi:DNA helicase-2/ATP-dependent DNA helicase PcrA
VEAMLIEKNIPYIFIGGTSFLQAAHVKDLLCLVRAAASNNDELAWIRYLTLWPKIGDVTASRLISSMKDMGTIDEALDQLSGKLKKEQQKIVEQVPVSWNLSCLRNTINGICEKRILIYL